MEPQKEELKKLGQALKALPPQEPSADFDRRFWENFETQAAARPAAGLKIGLPVRLFLGAGLAAALVLLALPALRPASPKVSALFGKIELETRSGKTWAAEAGQDLQNGQKITTGRSGWAVIDLENKCQIKIHPDSEVLIQRLKPRFLPGNTVLHLAKGEILVSTGHGERAKYPVEIRTPDAFASAIGTQFAVKTGPDPAAASIVRVLEGQVAFGAMMKNAKVGSSRQMIGPGYEASVSDGAVKPRKMVEETLAELEELFQYNRANRAVLLISMGPYRVRDLLSPCMIYLRFEKPDRNTAEIVNVVRRIQAAGKEKDPSKHEDIVRRLESLIDKQPIEMRPALTLFCGAYYAFLKDYVKSAEVFEAAAKKYPDSSHRSLALLAASIVQKKHLRNFPVATELAIKVLEEYPDSYELTGAKAVLGYIPKPTETEQPSPQASGQ